MRLLILGSQPRQPRGTNCEISEDLNFVATEIINELDPLKAKKRKICDKNPKSNSDISKSKPSYQLLNTDDFVPEEKSLKYLAGYLAWSLKRKRKGIFRTPTSLKPVCKDQTSNWIQVLSHGGLLCPNDEIISTVLNAEPVFVETVKNIHLENINSVFQKAILDRFPKSNVEIVKELVKIRLKIRIRFLNEGRKYARNTRKLICIKFEMLMN